jgi:hypothetical protein
MKKQKSPKTVNRRVDVAPEGGLLAMCGFYTRQVQAVVRRWEGKVTPGVLEDNLPTLFRTVRDGRLYKPVIEFHGIICRTDWKAIFELGIAIAKVIHDDSNIDKWLLTSGYSVASNGGWPSWDSIAEDIGKRVGQSRSVGFTNTVKQRYKRLKLMTPPDEAAAFMESWPLIWPMNPAVTKPPGKT